jgi:hypothetical protein
MVEVELVKVLGLYAAWTWLSGIVKRKFVKGVLDVVRSQCHGTQNQTPGDGWFGPTVTMANFPGISAAASDAAAEYASIEMAALFSVYGVLLLMLSWNNVRHDCGFGNYTVLLPASVVALTYSAHVFTEYFFGCRNTQFNFDLLVLGHGAVFFLGMGVQVCAVCVVWRNLPQKAKDALQKNLADGIDNCNRAVRETANDVSRLCEVQNTQVLHLEEISRQLQLQQLQQLQTPQQKAPQSATHLTRSK